MFTDKYTHVNECFYNEAYISDAPLLAALEGVQVFLMERSDYNSSQQYGVEGFHYDIYFHESFDNDPVIYIPDVFSHLDIESKHSVILNAAKICGNDWRTFKETINNLGLEDMSFRTVAEFEEYMDQHPQEFL